MKIKKLSVKLVLGILPPVIIGMIALALISAQSGRKIIEEQMEERMMAELSAQKAGIDKEMSIIENTAKDLALNMGSNYKNTTPYSMENMLSELVEQNKNVYGSGFWFEPKAYKLTQDYVGPYAYREGDEVSITYAYSTHEYDYLSQEYYVASKSADGPFFLDPYYDETSDIVMLTCTSPMYNTGGSYIGCATVDMSLESIKEEVQNIKIGEGGDAILVTSEGVYLGCADEEKVDAGIKITEETSGNLAQAGEVILSGQSGITEYRDGSKSYKLYYDTIPEIGWKIIMRIPQSELDAPISRLLTILGVVCLVAVVACLIMILYQARRTASGVKKVHGFAQCLADGDFSVQTMNIRRVDELGEMGRALNVMYQKNKNVLENISVHAANINTSSENLNGSAKVLSEQFENIARLLNGVNEAMMSTSASTEELNASAEEVSSSVNVLAGETEKSLKLTTEIKSRAKDVEKVSRDSYDYAIKLSKEYEVNLGKSIENAAVVESVGKMAEVISEIAEQINLLSLNASIEAARAGELGRGFAVVALEIGKLANETADAVTQIQKTIEDVKGAFSLLTKDSESLLGFLKDTVTPDYDKFVGVAKQYGNDAIAIEESTARISEMATNIEHIMGEVASAVQTIAESAQETADNSGQIMGTVDEVTTIVDQVSEMSREQEDIAVDLNKVVGNFKLN